MPVTSPRKLSFKRLIITGWQSFVGTNSMFSLVLWHIYTIPDLRREKQEGWRFEASLVYTGPWGWRGWVKEERKEERNCWRSFSPVVIEEVSQRRRRALNVIDLVVGRSWGWPFTSSHQSLSSYKRSWQNKKLNPDHSKVISSVHIWNKLERWKNLIKWMPCEKKKKRKKEKHTILNCAPLVLHDLNKAFLNQTVRSQ